MSLTLGSGPLSRRSHGELNLTLPERVVLVEPFPRRVRGVLRGRVAIDSDSVKLVHVSDRLPAWSFPGQDVQEVETEADPDLEGHVRVAWAAVDAWFEEDERVFVHTRDPYHRVDAFSTSRRVEVALGDRILAATTRAIALYETGLPVRWYLPRADVRMEALRPSPTVTQCPYKGTARYFSAVGPDGKETPDVAWTYVEDLRREGRRVEGLVAFDDTKVFLRVDPAP